MFRCLLLCLGLLPVSAFAQVYKCVSAAGHTTYSQAPCPDASGETTELRVQSSIGPNLPPARADNESERVQLAEAWAYKRYPFLDGESSKANEAAIGEVIDIRDRAIQDGELPADALVKAVSQVGPRYTSAEVVRRNIAAAEIMSGPKKGGGGVTVVGQGGEDGCRVERFQPFDKRQESFVGTRIPGTDLVNVHDFGITIRCAKVVVSCGGAGSRLVSAGRLQARFVSGATAQSTTKGHDIRVSGGESVSVSACFGGNDAPLSSIIVR